MSFSRFIIEESVFCLLIVFIVSLLYVNSLQGTFIWDDRAAVVKNGDVLEANSVWDLLYHDFWGADISLVDSHKSYRPVTVATFRANHHVSGLDSYSFHVANAIIYILSSLSVYALNRQWLNSRAARIASLLFVCHPVHVEAVTSIVGRADSLCGLFYFLALLTYTNGVRAASNKASSLSSVALTGVSVLFAMLATFSKEIGFTVVGAFVVIEVLERMRNQREQRFQQKPSQECSIPQVSSTSAIIAAVQQCVTSLSTLARTALLVACSAAYFQLRSRLHGSRAVYRWTIMENHVHHLPSLYERALSYAQYHYLYLWKLVYPAELCFDYGYACVPTVHTLADPLNLRPLMAYATILLLVMYALLRVRINLLLGMMLLLVPLTPALNIVMPVGALVAERLLFIPSAGFCIIVAELLTVDVWCLQGNVQCDTLLAASHSEKVAHVAASAVDTSESVEMEKADHPGSGSVENAVSPLKKRVSFENIDSASRSPRKAKSGAKRMQSLPSPTPTRESGRSAPSADEICVVAVKPTRGESFAKKWLPWCLVLPVLVWCGRRVVLRNEDWRDEYSLYKSGLDVCPRSLKVLTNYALLAMARQQYDAGLSAALAAVEIYPEQVAALVNAGVAYQKLGQYANSVDMFQRCLAVNPAMAKAEGYMGVSYYYWASVQSAPIAAKLLREEALKHFNAAVEAGFQAPLILHLTGTTLLELKRPEDSAVYYEAALQQSANYASYYQQKGVPILLEDDIDPVSALNQLGSVYWSLRDADKAIDTFERGLRIAPQSIPLLTNLGNVYRERGDTQRAREMMRLGIQYSAESVPPALYNNLGLLELNAGNFRDALGLFEQALAAHVREIQVMGGGEGNSVGADGGGAEAVIRGNIQRALGGLQN